MVYRAMHGGYIHTVTFITRNQGCGLFLPMHLYDLIYNACMYLHSIIIAPHNTHDC